ncbi:MAG: amino acid ABC transporter substrate-binding protein [Clostridia bacterium]|nr:amino acid ABC transporter substrate-binding protein [Clostridia bacterium]
MKKLIRSIALILSLALLALPLTACSSSDEGEGGENEPANRLEAIQQRGYLEVATEPYFPPCEFIDPSKQGDDKYVGADIELARYIAEKLGVECRIVPLEFQAVLAGVGEGKYDMAISALGYMPSREEAMNLSKGYYFSETSLGHGLIIREEMRDEIKGVEDLEGKTIVYQSGSLQELFVEQQIPVEVKEKKRVSGSTEIYLSVQEGKADCAIASLDTAMLYIEANEGCGLIPVEGFTFFQDESTLGTRIGMPKGEDELTAKVNEIIDEVLETGVYENWYNEYADYAASLGL